MKKKATLVHLNGLASVTPLVGGYLKAYAHADSEVHGNWDIELYNGFFRTPASEVLGHLVERAPDVVGFSMYTWNVRLVMRLLSGLRGVLAPSTKYLLGGVEVMHCADSFLRSDWDDVAVCNGEGEKTFRDYLLQLGCQAPDLGEVRGLSFYRDGELVTTEKQDRIRDLSEIPSPWLTGVFTPEDMGDIALFETNRGCPYKCEFCYWGGAVGQKITRLGVDRVKDELTYIAKHGTKTLTLCDANFGQLREDIEIAEHIANLKREYRAPGRVTYNSAKNRIDRVENIARTFSEAKLLSTHAISLQSVSPKALELAKRSNIKSDVYFQLQQKLNEWDLPSYIELIWPLPGETLDSFKQGVNKLCSMGAQSFFVHPLLWLNNVGYTQRTEELGVSLLDSDDSVGGPPIVIRTKEVPYKDYLEGLLFSAALLFLYSFRGLYSTLQIVNALKTARISDVLSDFVDWMHKRSGDPVSDLWHNGRVQFEKMSLSIWPGSVGDCVLNSNRADFDRLLMEFVTESCGRWTERAKGDHAALIEAAAEFDLLTRPYLYLTTRLDVGTELRHIEIISRRRSVWEVRSPFDFPSIVNRLRTGGALSEADLDKGLFQIEIDHRTRQSIPPSTWGEEEYYWHGSMAAREIGQFDPHYSVQPGATTPG